MEFFQIIGIIVCIYVCIGILVGYIEYYCSDVNGHKDLPLFALVIMCIFVWPWALNERFKDQKKKYFKSTNKK